MLSQEIRHRFLGYFGEREHQIVASSSVIPQNDPTLLFTNAGMNQFKELFLGREQRSYTKAASSQKCIRVGGKHNDLDNVGHTTRHLTFFEMLGNFSFGAYFKKEAIAHAWSVATTVFQFETEGIWASVLHTDEEAFELWKTYLPPERIIRLGERDNFWSMGETGPCGPCSELLFDRGEKYGEAPSPREDLSGERYLEFWNLVFMQFSRDEQGKISPLPRPSIDTGAGLERIVSLKMGVNSVFATDILRHLIDHIEQLTSCPYRENGKEAPPFHVIADHLRALAFAIGDGAQPSNVERGYILRKLVRRAARYGRLLAIEKPFLATLVPPLIDVMGSDFPELKKARAKIEEVLTLEEEGFLRTLKRGGNILHTILEEAAQRPRREITGEEAFKLKDTYGFPLEEILLMAKDAHLEVNLDSYQLLEEKAKEIARASHLSSSQEMGEEWARDFLTTHSPSQFLGYTATETEATVVGLFRAGSVTSFSEGEEGDIILDQTPFYAEKGGQVGDTGILLSPNSQFTCNSCSSPYPGIILHRGKCEKGTIRVGDRVHVSIDVLRRLLIQNNHTATHLLHFALEQVLGPHIRQAGSLVTPSYLRFDFNHSKSLTQEEVFQIEDLVNQKIRENQEVKSYELPYEEVQRKGEIKQFFGDKYGPIVRVIELPFSKELCGGTHTSHTGTLGYFRITGKKSIASGVYRLEAVTGKEGELFARRKEGEFQEQIAGLHEDQKKQAQLLKNARRLILTEKARSLLQTIVPVASTSLLTARVDLPVEELPQLAELLMQGISSGLLLLGVEEKEKGVLLLRVTPDLAERGIHAKEIIGLLAPLIGGSGGGKELFAQAGGAHPQGVPLALEKIKQLLLDGLS